MARNYFVNIAELTGYSPANHTETVNKRVIGPETVGANQLEVVLGHVRKNTGALPHAHPGIEQVCYMLEGRARVEVGGQSREIGPGEACFFPADEETRLHGNIRRSQSARHLRAPLRGKPEELHRLRRTVSKCLESAIPASSFVWIGKTTPTRQCPKRKRENGSRSLKALSVDRGNA